MLSILCLDWSLTKCKLCCERGISNCLPILTSAINMDCDENLCQLWLCKRGSVEIPVYDNQPRTTQNDPVVCNVISEAIILDEALRVCLVTLPSFRVDSFFVTAVERIRIERITNWSPNGAHRKLQNLFYNMAALFCLEFPARNFRCQAPKLYGSA